MKQILLMIAVVALVGCGKKEAPKQQTEANATVTPNAEPPKAAAEKLITDPIVEKAVREYLDKPTGELTKTDLENVTSLDLEKNQLTDVKGLENLTQLTRLELINNKLTDVKGLEKLTQLEYLDLGANKLTDVKGLEKLTQLVILGLDKNQLTDVKSLEKLTQLWELYLGGNKLTDVKGLEKLTQLQFLYLANNPNLAKAQIAELKKALPKCRIMSEPPKAVPEKLIADPNVEEAIREELEKPTGELTKADLAKVTSLALGHTQITDEGLKDVAKLQKLEVLWLCDNQITDAGLKDVAKLQKLTELTLSGTKVTKAGVAELQKALPNCQIYDH